MKIAVDCRYIGSSGLGTYNLNLVRSLVKHEEHQYTLIVKHIHDEFLDLKNIRQVINTERPLSIHELFLTDCGEINKYDVFLSPSIAVPLGIKIPIYITLHDVVFMDIPELAGKIGYWTRRLYMQYAIHRAKAVFTVSNFSKKQITKHFNPSVPIYVTGNVVADKIRTTPITGFCKEDYFIYVGNVKAHKGLPTLLSAYKEACRCGLKTKLKIVGEANSFRTKEQSLNYITKELEGVEFTGRVSDEKLIELIGKAKALVLPTRYEGFGIPPLEALYLGTNAIVSDIDVLKEVYSELPVTYFHVDNADDLKDKLLSFEASPIDQSQMRKKIDSIYDMDRMAQMVLDKILENNIVSNSTL